MTFNQGKNVFFCQSKECLSPHGQSVLAKKAENWAGRSLVPTLEGMTSTLWSKRTSSPVWFGMTHCSLSGLVKCYFHKTPFNRKLFFFLLLYFLLLPFLQQKIATLESDWVELDRSSNSSCLGKTAADVSRAIVASLLYTGVPKISQR